MIDPKLATDAKVFVELTGNLSPAKRGFLGTPIPYFTTHTPAERMACLVAATGFSESVIKFLTTRFPENAQIFKEYLKIKDIFPEEYVVNPFIQDHILIKKYFKEVIEFNPESLKFLDPQHLPTGDYSPTILTGSFHRMFGTFELFKLLGLDTECFKYWRHNVFGDAPLSNQSYEKALNSIGYSSKSIMRVIIQQSRARYGTAGFLGEVLDLKYLNNVLDMQACVISLLERSHKVFGLPRHPLDVFWGRLTKFLLLDGIADGLGAMSIFRFYLHQYRRWADHSDVLMMGDGVEFYSHRHGMINSYLRQTHVKVPESLATPPSALFKEYIVEHAKNEYTYLQKEYKDYVFENRDEEFRHLPADKYRYLKTPIDLVLEGRNMNHCVGGREYYRW